jgi:copper chaperone
METLNFKTNIQSSDDVASVTLNLNDIEQVDGWNIDTNAPDNLLTVQTTDNRIADLVQKAVEKAGYRAELVTT